MLELKNRTPYAAERAFFRDADDALQWVVAVKASYDLSVQGAVVLCEEQAPVLLAPEYYGEPGQSSLRHDSDLTLMKPATDLTVLAHAHAPQGRPAEAVPVSVRLGERQKVLMVHGTRVFYRSATGIAPYRASAFVSKPLRYEQAYGGTDKSESDSRLHSYDNRNPIGLGFARRSASLIDMPAPTIEYTHGEWSTTGPAGFGPIASHWSPRLLWAGTYDELWMQTRRPLLPRDWDARSTLCSPADQRAPHHLHGGELLELVNLTPEGVLRFELPKVYLTFTTRVAGKEIEHRSRMVSAIVDLESMKLRVVWQTTLKVAARQLDQLEHTIIRQKPYLR